MMMWTIHQKAIYGLYGELFSDGQAVFPIIIPHRIVFPRSSLLCIRWLEKRHEFSSKDGIGHINYGKTFLYLDPL